MPIRGPNCVPFDTPPAVLLRESYREAGKTKNRATLSISV